MSGQAETKSTSSVITVCIVITVAAFLAALVILIVLLTSSVSLRVDFFTTQQAKLIGAGNSGPASQGSVVALSRDGNTLAVGGPLNGGIGGAVWIFVRALDTKIWSQQQILVPSDGTPLVFGASVAISDDGNTIVAGSVLTDAGVGGVWVFGRVGTVWTQQGLKILPVTYPLVNVNNNFGNSVSISGDGKMFVAGAYGDNASFGATYVYEKIANVWTEKQKLVGTGSTGIVAQGVSVCISQDGSVIAVGGNQDVAATGATWIFTRSGTGYVQAQKIVGTGGVGIMLQGTSVALNSDGSILAIGGFQDNSFLGAVWMFKREGELWVQQKQKLVGNGLTGTTGFGSSVALNGEGNILAVSCPNNNASVGGFFAFVYNGTNWIQKQNFKTLPSGSIGATPFFGKSLSMSRDGKTLAVGANADNTNQGATYIFV